MPAAQTTLAAAITTTNGTSCTVRDALGFAAATDTDDVVLIGSEFLRVTAGMGTTSWTISRGYAGSTAATHIDGKTVTRIERGYTSLSRLKTQVAVTDTDDDALLLDIIAAVNAEITDRIGLFLGPSTDTVRTYDGCDALRNGTRLYIPGGIRSLTQVRTAGSDGGSMTTQTATDFALRPKAWELRSGAPYMWVETLDGASFPGYRDNVELTGTFGYASVPENLAKLADMVSVRMWNDRNAGSLASPTPSKFIFADDAALLARHKAEHFAMVA